METSILGESPEEIQNLSNQENLELAQTFEDRENYEISINYVKTKTIWNQIEMKNIGENKVFCYIIASDITNGNEDLGPKSFLECQNGHDWSKWKNTIQAKLNSLNQKKDFGLVIFTYEDVKPFGYRWVFARKRNEKNGIIIYKARLLIQGLSQRLRIDYEKYSPIMYGTTF